MRKYIWLFLTVFLLTAFTACQPEADSEQEGSMEGSIQIYYTNTTDNGLISTPYVPSQEGEAAIREVFEIVQRGQFGDGHSAVPSSVTLSRMAWQTDCLVLYLTGDYPEVGSMGEILCRFALVQTLVQLPDVEGVSINVNEEPLTDMAGMEIGVMRADSFLANVTTAEGEPESLDLKLYFLNAEGNALVAETTEVVRRSEETVESLVIKQLIAGPSSSDDQAVLPPGTGLISVQVTDEICYVNLDHVFIDSALPINENLVVYAIVNSLTELDGVEAVQLTIEGSADINFGGKLSFASPFERNMDWVAE